MPGRRAALYIILITVLLLGLATGETLFFTMTYFTLGTLILSLLWTWTGLVGLRLERSVPAQRGQVGRSMDEQLTLRNRSLLPRLWVEIRDDSTLPGHHASRVVFRVPRRGAYRWQANTRCRQRGVYRLGPATLVSGDPFGFFEIRRQVPQSTEVVIYPATFPIPGFTPGQGRLQGGEAISERTHVITPNVSGVRDYVHGDEFRQIHWLTTARRGRLTVKEFEMDPLADYWIVLDNYEAAHVPDYANNPLNTTEEYGVATAASLVAYFVEKQRKVGLVTYAPGRMWLQADHGPRQLRKALELLATTQATGSRPLQEVLRLEGERFARTMTVIVITPSVEVSWLAAVRWLKYRRVQMLVIHIDPLTFGGAPGAEQIHRAAGRESVPLYVLRRGDNISMVLGAR